MVSAITVRLLFLLAFALAPSMPAQQGGGTPNTRSPHGALSIPCQNCHTVSGWKPIRSVPEFDHNTTRYPLRGMHKNVACTQCHTNLVFTKVGNQCADCHADIHRRQMGARCEQCHTVMGWTVSIKAIQQHENRFPLVGAHALLQCDACHKGAATGQFQGLPTDCTGCHMGTYLRTKSPNHQATGFPTNCKQCHTSMDTWLGAKVDHSQFGFPLTGAHAQLECAACHVGGKFQGTPTNCVSCHLKDFNATTNPNHAQAGFPQTCAQCHNTNTWAGAVFDHAAFTGFALTGAHSSLACTQCHVNGQFQGTPTNCVSCHMTDFNNTTNPAHAAAGFPQTCAQCHTTVSWTGARFDHTSIGFALTGAHASLSCTQCHVGGKFAGTPATCVSCHLNDFNAAKNPDHAALGFPQTCAQCHTTITWAGATFDHNSMTPFPLTGAHVTVACSQCHIGGKFAGTPTDCASCHLPLFQKTTNPNHVAAGFPTDCSVCHTTVQWPGATFDHSKTLFPLVGAHVGLSCSSCHASGVFKGLSTACVSCHLKDFNATTNPNHVSSGFPQQCEMCHTAAAWQPSTFNHATTAFPLTGAHTSVPCASCHVGGRFAGTPTDCYSCHKSDYTGTTNPNHVAAAFPTTCTTCHNTTQWTGATFNHTWFPIYSGTHAGKWTTCADCHTNPSNYAAFTCTSCHAHDQTAMDQAHRGVRNYVYNSANCYSCHPVGRAN